MRRTGPGPLLGAICVGLLSAGDARAQDTNYWSNQYGTRAELLGGMVTGALLDLSASYYNPGALAYADDPTLVQATSSWEFQTYSLDDRLLTDLHLSASRLRNAPSLFAFQFSSRNSKNKFVFSALTRYNLDFRVGGRRYADGDGQSYPLRATEVVGEIRLGEGWMGLSWARRAGENLGLGVTTYVAARSHFSRTQLHDQQLSAPDTGFQFLGVNESSYSHYRIFWKLGAAWTGDRGSVGITVTTPSIGVYGRGRRVVDLGEVSTSGPNLLAATDQKDLSAEYRSAPALALGLSRQLGEAKVYASAEWFAGIPAYTIIDGRDYVGQTTGALESAAVEDALASVFNWGLGIERPFGNEWTAYAAFSSDESSYARDVQSPLAFSSWDLYHLTVGAALKFGRADITLGLGYGWGIDDFPTSIPGAEGLDVVELRYRRVKGIFGFTFGFGGGATDQKS